ncbi:MAG: endo-1,4-beta-xylanase [Clostridia bacterium]|nr:endo-1,4-beta-xylanase [Clostridia bacterium]
MKNFQTEKLDEIRALYEAKYNEYEGLDQKIQEGIEKNRKGDCVLNLGKEMAGKTVRIKQKSHAFKFGANLLLLDQLDTAEKNQEYRELFAKYFNLATIPFYWDTLEQEEGKPRYAADSPNVYRRPATDLCMDYCREYGVEPKLHVLYYDKFSPKWLYDADLETCLKKLEQRFGEIAERYAGKMFEVEVVNEHFCVYDRKTALSRKRDIVKHCFDMAERYFPADRLTINETGSNTVLTKEDMSPYYLYLDSLLKQGAKIDRIGIQRHQFTGVTAMDQESYEESVLSGLKNYDVKQIYRDLDLLAEFGKPVEITEVTVPTFTEEEAGEQLQADLLEKLYSIWFSHPAVDAIVYWNSCDGYAFVEPGRNENNCRGGLFHRDLTPKKAAERLYYLINEKWHTDLTLTADEEGVVRFRGFYGDYQAVGNGDVKEFSIEKEEK